MDLVPEGAKISMGLGKISMKGGINVDGIEKRYRKEVGGNVDGIRKGPSHCACGSLGSITELDCGWRTGDWQAQGMPNREVASWSSWMYFQTQKAHVVIDL